jgi:hypothetical protein
VPPSARTASTASLRTIVVLAQSVLSSVEENTYFGSSASASVYGSPPPDQAGAK